MAITFRHDAAAVGLPSVNNAGRKYGQELVLQQQQQKYEGFQRGLDRWYDAAQQQGQNNFQLFRDQRQAEADRKARKHDFKLGERQRQTDFERQQQAQEAERQRGFLDEARKQQGRFIMDAIENGEFDDVTARELRQNLIDEAEALGNPQLDATQRAEALEKIRARRATLLASRQPKSPPPSAQEQFEQGIVVDPSTGMRYRQNARGDWEPMPQQQQQPSSPGEAFRSDPKLRSQYTEDAVNTLTNGGEVALADVESLKGLSPQERRAAINKLAMDLYEVDQASFGGGQPAQGQSWAAKEGFKPTPDAAVVSDGSLFYVPTTTGTHVTFKTEEEANSFIASGQPAQGQGQPPAATAPPASPAPASPQNPEQFLMPGQATPAEQLRDQLAPPQNLGGTPYVPSGDGMAENPWAEVATPTISPDALRSSQQPAAAQAPADERLLDVANAKAERDFQAEIASSGVSPEQAQEYINQARKEIVDAGLAPRMYEVLQRAKEKMRQGGGKQQPSTTGTPKQGRKDVPMAANRSRQSVPATATKQQFSRLRKQFSDDTETQNEINALEQAIGGSKSPEVQQAGLVVMQMLGKYAGKPPAPGSDDFNSLRNAMRVLAENGIDLAAASANAKYQDRAEKIRAANEQAPSNYNIFPGEM